MVNWIQELYLSPSQWSKSYGTNQCEGYYFKSNGEVQRFGASFDSKELSSVNKTISYGGKTIYISSPWKTYLWKKTGDNYVIDPANDPAIIKLTDTKRFVRSWSGTSSTTFIKISN